MKLAHVLAEQGALRCRSSRTAASSRRDKIFVESMRIGEPRCMCGAFPGFEGLRRCAVSYLERQRMGSDTDPNWKVRRKGVDASGRCDQLGRLRGH